jgi:hypothetical protein
VAARQQGLGGKGGSACSIQVKPAWLKHLELWLQFLWRPGSVAARQQRLGSKGGSVGIIQVMPGALQPLDTCVQLCGDVEALCVLCSCVVVPVSCHAELVMHVADVSFC